MEKRVLDVPKIRQLPGAYCGVACLSMVLSYLGLRIGQKELAEYFEDPEMIKEEGVNRYEIVLAARILGFTAHSSNNMDLDDIIRLIDKDLPLIARCRTDRPGWNHLYTVVGYEDNLEQVFVNDPPDLRRKKFSYDEFSRLWIVEGSEGSRNYGITVRKK